ncbi:hypothetical protein ACGFK1_15890 [Mycobacterium sp. NPDC048908]|uniref:hypothetical protein n=1 Tax=Mycobacterium sp. NPDC048908 TaxID=3364292 RepID=UPI0037117BAD
MTEDYGTARWVAREDVHARQVLHTAKLVVMFSLPVAAGFVVGAMQNNDKGGWSETAAILMLIAALFTMRVILTRMADLKLEDVTDKSPEVVQEAFKEQAQADKKVARSAHRWMVCQVLLSLASSFAAAMALLLG